MRFYRSYKNEKENKKACSLAIVIQIVLVDENSIKCVPVLTYFCLRSM